MKMRSNPRPVRRPPKKTVVKSSNIVKKKMTAKNKKAENQNVKTKPKIVVSKSKVVKGVVVKPLKSTVKSQEKIISKVRAKKILENIDIKDLKSPKKRVQLNKKKMNVSETLKKKVEENKTVVKNKEEDTSKKPIDKKTPKVKNVEKTPVKLKKAKKVDEIKPIDVSETKDKVVNKKVKPIGRNSPSKVVETQLKKKIKKVVVQKEVVSNNKIINNIKLTPSNVKDVKVSKINQIKLQKTTKKENVDEIENNVKIVHNKSDIKTIPKTQKPIKVEPKEEPIDEKVLKVIKIEPVKSKVHKVELPKNKVVKSKPKKIKSSPVEKDSDSSDKLIKTEQIDGIMKANKSKDRTKIVKFAKIIKPKSQVKNKIKEEKKIKHECSSGGDEDSRTSDEITLNVLRQHQLKDPKNERKRREEYNRMKKIKMESSESEDDEVKKLPNKRSKVPQSKDKKNILKNHSKAKPTAPKIVVLKKRIMKSPGSPENRRMKLFSFWNGPKRHRVASLNALAKVHCLYENESRGAMLEMLKKQRKPASDSDPPPSPPSSRTLRSGPGVRGGVGKHWDVLNAMSSSSEDISEQESSVESTSIEPYKKTSVAEKKEDNKTKKEVKRRRNRTEIVMDLKDMVVRKRMASLNATAILAASYSPEKRSSKGGTDLDDSDEDEDDDDDYSETSETVTSDQSKRRCYEPDVKEDGKLIEVRATPNKKKVAVIVNQDTDVTITGVYVNSTTRSTHHLHEGYCSIAGMQYRISATSHTQTNATAVATTETLLHGGVHVPPQPPDHHVVHHGEPQGVGHEHCCTVQSPDSLHSPSTTGAPPPSYTPLSALSSMQPPGAPVSPSGVPPPAPGPPPVQHQPLPSRRPPTCAHGSSAFTAPYMHHHHHHHPHGPAKMEPPPPHLPPPPPPVPVASHHGYIHGYYQPAGPLITTHHTHPPHVALSKPAPVSAPPAAQQPPLSPPTQVSAPAASTSSSNDASSLAADTDVVITDPPQTVPQVSAPPQQQTLPPPPPQSQPPIHAYRYTQSYPQPPSSHPTPAGYPYAYPAQYYTSPPGGSLQYSPQQHYHPQDLCYTAPAPFFHPKAYSSAPPASYHRRYIPAPAQYYTTGPDVYSSSQSQQTSQMVTSSVTASSGHRGGYGPPGGPPPALVEPYPPPPPPGPVSIVEPYPPPPYYTSYGAGPACYSHSPPTRSLPFIDAAYQPCPCPMESCPKNVHTGPLTGDGKRSNMTPIAKESSGVPLPPVALALPLEPASVNGPPSPARGSAGMPPPPSPAGATYQPSSTPKQETTEESKPVEKVRRKARVGKNMVRNTIANFNNNNNNSMRQDTLLLMCHNPVVSKEVKRETISPPEDVIVLEKKQDILIEEIKNDMTNNNNNNYKIEHKDTITDLCIKEDLLCKDVITEVKKEVARRLSACKEEIKTDSESEKIEVKSTEVIGEEKTAVVAAKRKLSTETCEEESIVQKKQKLNKNLSSYKDLIKKTNKTCVKINNGKRKLNIDSEKGCPKSYLKFNSPKVMVGSKNKKRTGVKRKSPTLTEEPQTKKIKTPKPLAASNLHNAKQNQKSVKLVTEEPLLSENLEPTTKINKKTAPSKISKKTAPALLDSLFLKNNVDRTIESVIKSVCVEEVVPPPAPPKKCISVIDENVKKDADMFKKPAKKCQSVKTKMEPPKQPIKPILKSENKKKSKTKIVENAIIAAPRIFKKVTPQPKWSNGWSWEGEPFQGKIFLNSDEPLVSRTCYPAMRHKEGDLISPRDCVLLKSGTRKIDLPFVAKVASLWENPDDGEMMMSLLWYYRPEHTEQGRLPTDQPDEVFASRHKDINSVACIEDKCYVLTFNEYCRYRKNARRLEEGLESPGSVVPQAEGEVYPRAHRQPPASLSTSPDMVFFCRRVYDFRQKRIMKNPS